MPYAINTPPRRAVIVGGVRTPFVRAFGKFMQVDTIGLGVAAVKGLLAATGVPRSEIDSVIWGGVILPTASPNVGREIALDVGLPPTVEAMTVSRACASGLQAITLAAAHRKAVAAAEKEEATRAMTNGALMLSLRRDPCPLSAPL